MNTVSRSTRVLLLAMIATLVALTGCGDNSVDDQTVRPAIVCGGATFLVVSYQLLRWGLSELAPVRP